MQMIMFLCCLSTPQEFFLKTACELSERYGWFNRKDVFSQTCSFMPYTVGLALYRRGLLETDPQDHPSGYDLGFKITDIGRRLVNDDRFERLVYKLILPEKRTYIKFSIRGGRWHILFAQDRGGFQMECGRRIGYFSNPETIGESELGRHKVCGNCLKTVQRG